MLLVSFQKAHCVPAVKASPSSGTTPTELIKSNTSECGNSYCMTLIARFWHLYHSYTSFKFFNSIHNSVCMASFSLCHYFMLFIPMNTCNEQLTLCSCLTSFIILQVNTHCGVEGKVYQAYIALYFLKICCICFDIVMIYLHQCCL